MHYIILIVTFFATFLAQLFTRSVTVVFEVLTKRLLIISAVLAVLASFVAGFYVAIDLLMGSISSVAPPFLNQAASLFLPTNLTELISIQITARLARWVYEWNVKVLQWRL